MSLKLFFEAIIKFSLGVLLVGLFVFLPVGTLQYLNGWIFMATLFIPMFIAGLVMLAKNPTLLQERLQAKEKRKTQDMVVKISGLMFIAGFVLSGLNFRFQWYTLPKLVSIIACIFFLFSYVLYAEVLRENTYLSRTIKVSEGQKVVDTGLYGIVRHPMYMATLILFFSIPLILGSLYATIVFLIYPILIAKRIQDEEKLLEVELKGYTEYKKKVKYRLIPFIW